MGDFSRDPDARLLESVAQHYVGVRLQQGVPILDTDWNELEDLRRHEVASIGSWFLGDGVPVGSDGFRIVPITGGGTDTIILTSTATAVGPTAIRVDLAASTAASALGFGPANAVSERFGSSPAALASSRSQPFALTPGSTLVVQADDHPEETVVFEAADFPDIGAATAAQVVALLNAGLGHASASTGQGNDFLIRGGDGTTAGAGRILIDGQVVLNERELRYSHQALYENSALAALWGVDPVAALTTPAADEPFAVYLDAWHREVDSAEDLHLVPPAIGVETSTRLRREWAVRVARAADVADVFAGRPPGHSYHLLALLARVAGNPVIARAMISDRRATEHSLRRAVAYRDDNGAVVVDSAGFRNMLVRLRDTVRDFIAFLTSRFVDADSGYVAGEVAGVDALASIANLADHGIALIHAETLGTQGALDFFGQLLDAENRFVDVWRDAVLPLDKPGGKIYQLSYQGMVDRIEAFLTGPAPIGFTSIADALEGRNLRSAMNSQEQVTSEFGDESERPFGVLFITYLGSPASLIQPNISFDMQYEISGSVTPQDDLDVDVFIDPAWQVTLLNEGGTLPLGLQMGPGDDIERFVVRVRPPDDAAAEAQINLRVSARRNPTGLSRNTPQLTLRVGQPPPGSEAEHAFTIQNASVPLVGGVYEVPVSTVAGLTYRLWNNTDAALEAEFELDPASDPNWSILPTFGASDTVPPNATRDYVMQYGAPASDGLTLTSTLIARHSATSEIAAQITITMRSV